MSDLAATNCGCECNSGCNSFGGGGNLIWLILILSLCGGNGLGGGSCNSGCGGNGGCDIIWIIILLSCCGGNGFC